MAVSAKGNLWFYSGDPMEKQSEVAVDSQTWKAGQPATRTSTGKVKPAARGATNIVGLFADSRSTATSSTTVKVYKIVNTTQKLAGYVCNAGNDTTAQQTHIGERAGLYVASNSSNINVGNDTGIFRVTDVMWQKEAFKNASTDSPGILLVQIWTDTMIS